MSQSRSFGQSWTMPSMYLRIGLITLHDVLVSRNLPSETFRARCGDHIVGFIGLGHERCPATKHLIPKCMS